MANLITRTGKAVHLPATSLEIFPKCEPTGSSRVGGFSAYRRTAQAATCKRCLKAA